MAEDEYVRELQERLQVAERVCGLVGINASTRETDRGKALTQAWMDWSHRFSHRAVLITDEEVRELAARRDVVVEQTLARLARDYPEIAARRGAPEVSE